MSKVIFNVVRWVALPDLPMQYLSQVALTVFGNGILMTTTSPLLDFFLLSESPTQGYLVYQT
jgi:hypothetical protein